MRKQILLFLLCMMLTGIHQPATGQVPYIDIIKAAIKKVIKATDLMVQRIQNKTIGLQNIQRQVENQMSRLKLDAIGGWVEKQRILYRDYFEELRKVKAALSTYTQVRDIIQTGGSIANNCSIALRQIQKDNHFTVEEVAFMERVYGGILRETGKNLEQLNIVIQSFRVQMSDGERLNIIDRVRVALDKNRVDLHQFNQQTIQLSLHRIREVGEVERIKKLYGL